MEVPTIGVRTTATSVGTYGACFLFLQYRTVPTSYI